MTVQGAYIYIWDGSKCEGGDLAAIIAKAKAYKTGLIWKGDDGGRWYSQYLNGKNTPLTTLIDACEQAGVPAGAWGYHYGAPAGTNYYGYTVAGPAAELQRATETIQLAKPRFYAVNNEVEYEGRAAEAQNLASTLRATFPTTELVSACLPVIRYHLASPYAQFAINGFAQAPELYWSMFRNTFALNASHDILWGRKETLRGAGVHWELPVVYDPSTSERMITLKDGATSLHLLDATTLWQYWNQDTAQYNISNVGICPTYMDAALDAASEGISDAELKTFLALMDPTKVKSIWNWDYQHMDAAAFVRIQQVAEWLAIGDPAHQLDAALTQLKPYYAYGNYLLKQLLDKLEAAA